MKIDYVTIGNAGNVHNWSGLEFNIARTLENYVGEVNYIGDLNIKENFSHSFKKILFRLFGQRIDPVREPFFAKQCSDQVKSRLHASSDVVFSPGTVATALLKTDKPKIIYSDICFATYSSTYYSGVSNTTIKNGNYLERIALESATLSLFSSDYGARMAIDHYNLDPAKVKVVPFGANLNHEYSKEKIKENILQRSKNECHLLFIGVDWIRKGGEMAVKVAEKLNKRGLKTFLHIVGIKQIPMSTVPEFIINHGFISKTTRQGEEELIAIFSSCHFLLLPTKVEAYGLVFCEANSLGVPAIATNIGGIPTIIKNHVNGMMFSPDQEENDYVDYIFSIFCDSKRYVDLALSSYEEYNKRLNWRVAGKKISSLLKAI